ncbi:D-alanyl-D-alanine carboxypeptidase, partial [Actinotignum timonense]
PKEAAAHPLATVHSASVRELVDRMLTESDNTLAETLGHLVARERGESADFAGAARATRAALEELGYPLEGVVISDNSGLSETNRLTCVLQLAILEDLANLADGTVGALGAGLPVAALNGTLADRLTEGAAPGMIRGKTGTLADVVSLSGVLRTRSGALLTFSILTDSHHDVSLLDVRAAEDAFLTAVAEL